MQSRHAAPNDLTRELILRDSSAGTSEEDELGDFHSVVVAIVEEADESGVSRMASGHLQPRMIHKSVGPKKLPGTQIDDVRIGFALIADQQHDFAGWKLDEDEGSPYKDDWYGDGEELNKSTRIVDYDDPKGRTALFGQLAKVIDDHNDEYAPALILRSLVGVQDKAGSGVIWDQDNDFLAKLDTFFTTNILDEQGKGREGTPYGLFSARHDGHWDAPWAHGRLKFKDIDLSAAEWQEMPLPKGKKKGGPIRASVRGGKLVVDEGEDVHFYKAHLGWDPLVKNVDSENGLESAQHRPIYHCCDTPEFPPPPNLPPPPVGEPGDPPVDPPPEPPVGFPPGGPPPNPPPPTPPPPPGQPPVPPVSEPGDPEPGEPEGGGDDGEREPGPNPEGGRIVCLPLCDNPPRTEGAAHSNHGYIAISEDGKGGHILWLDRTPGRTKQDGEPHYVPEDLEKIERVLDGEAAEEGGEGGFDEGAVVEDLIRKIEESQRSRTTFDPDPILLEQELNDLTGALRGGERLGDDYRSEVLDKLRLGLARGWDRVLSTPIGTPGGLVALSGGAFRSFEGMLNGALEGGLEDLGVETLTIQGGLVEYEISTTGTQLTIARVGGGVIAAIDPVEETFTLFDQTAVLIPADAEAGSYLIEVDNEGGYTLEEFEPSSGALGVFGSGVMGAITFDGTDHSAIATYDAPSQTYTLTLDVFGTIVTVPVGYTVRNASHRILATERIENAGTISAVGLAASGSTSGGASLCGTYATLGRGAAGGAVNSPGSDTQDSLGGNGGAGGGTGGAAGVANQVRGSAVAGILAFQSAIEATTGRYMKAGGTWADVAGGGGGGGGQTASGGVAVSGAGGGGGGPILLAAPTIINTGTISARGGQGGNASGASGDGWGGGSGGGGTILIVYRDEYTNSGTVTAIAGLRGSKVGGGVIGGTGGNGQTVTVQLA